ncbi:hypothetical protein HMPREF9278_0118 [Mobiluncus mulieris FB024-16]|nr:hypothetical protein HMPREF9278_0118 [Mobiluncus mulieris FB024-16]
MLWLAPVAANSLLLPAGSLGFGDHRILGLRERGFGLLLVLASGRSPGFVTG